MMTHSLSPIPLAGRAGLTATAILALVWSGPSAAYACERGYCVLETFPADGATGAPTNTDVWIVYDVTDPPPRGSSLAPSGFRLLHHATDAEIETEVRTVEAGEPYYELTKQVAILQPKEELAPGATYRIEVLGETSACALHPTYRFTTGTGARNAAPEFGGARSAELSCWPRDFDGAPDDCHDESKYPFNQFAIHAEESPGAVAYRVYRDREPVALSPSLPASMQLLPEETDSNECFTLRAVSVTGVEDDNEREVCVDTASDGCGGARPDPDGGITGVDGGTDGGSPDAGGPVSGVDGGPTGADDSSVDRARRDGSVADSGGSPGGGGCCSTTRVTAVPPWTWTVPAATLTGALVRRRRRRRSKRASTVGRRRRI